MNDQKVSMEYHHIPAVNLRGSCASMNPRFGILDFMDRISDFMENLNTF